jgi:hypothetical protein
MPAVRRPGETDGPGPLSPLEQVVLAALLPAGRADMAALSDQARAATVASRTWSGVGFLTRFTVPAQLPAAAALPALRPLRATHPRLGEPVEFLLQVRDGRLATLEAFCGDGYWPEDETAFRLAASD